MPAAVRYTWMFRTAAVVFLFFGGVWLWRFGFTDFHVEQRPYGLAGGVVALLVGLFLFRGRRWAIGVSAIAAVIVGISAAVFAPNAKGPAILFLAALAIVCCVYAALAARVLSEQRHSENAP
jgi:peptidoglycan/LPS O-acetylase OafA/YrhL